MHHYMNCADYMRAYFRWGNDKVTGNKKEYAGIINKCYFGSKTIVTSTALPVDVDLLNGNIHFSHYIQSEVFFTILRGLGVVVY